MYVNAEFFGVASSDTSNDQNHPSPCSEDREIIPGMLKDNKAQTDQILSVCSYFTVQAHARLLTTRQVASSVRAAPAISKGRKISPKNRKPPSAVASGSSICSDEPRDTDMN